MAYIGTLFFWFLITAVICLTAGYIAYRHEGRYYSFNDMRYGAVSFLTLLLGMFIGIIKAGFNSTYETITATEESFLFFWTRTKDPAPEYLINAANGLKDSIDLFVIIMLIIMMIESFGVIPKKIPRWVIELIGIIGIAYCAYVFNMYTELVSLQIDDLFGGWGEMIVGMSGSELLSQHINGSTYFIIIVGLIDFLLYHHVLKKYYTT